MSDGEPFVRGLQRVEAGDMLTNTEKDLAAALRRLEAPRALINFDCVERRGELQRLGQCDEYAALFRDVPAIGFSTYGESYIGHINQTATMLLLG